MKQIIIKTSAEIEKMRAASRAAASVLEMIAPKVQVGVSTGELDDICHQFIVEQLKCIPAPLNYRGFPKSICTSVNQVVCHGIPSNNRQLKSGDIINIDITVIKDGYHGDTSNMFCVGKVLPHALRLIAITRQCLYAGIACVRPKAHLGDIGAAIQRYAESHGCSVVRDFCGHGIGTGFHEAPEVLHYGVAGEGITIESGMTFTIEPMINLGSYHVKVKPDGWTAVTRDGRLSAQFEHTIAVTADGCEVLSQRIDEAIPTP